MEKLLWLTITSFIVTAILLVPFIDFLYRVKFRRQQQVTKDMFNKHTPTFDKFNSWKVGTPVGGGVLIILVTTIWTLWAYGILGIQVKLWEVFVLFFSFITFGILGFYDDLKKLSGNKSGFWGLRFKHKFIIQWVLALIIATVFFMQLQYSFIFIHGFGVVNIGYLFIPFAAFVIVAFANSFNITDGLDGLATGLLIICLIAFLVISSAKLDQSLSIFILVLLGCLAAFLYFNIYKARLWLGDVGSLSLGAVLAVIGLLTGKTLVLVIIGGVIVLEGASSCFQLLSKRFLKRKIIPAAPLHLTLLKRGWEEPKVVMRAWLVGFILAIIGVFIAFV